jgi:TRAP transporter TAXI family solute receptor
MRVLAVLCGFALITPAFAQGLPVGRRAGSSPASETLSLDERERANQNTVTIISGTPAGTYLAVAYDMSAVLDDGDNLRVLAVAGRGSVQNVRDILNLRGIDMGIVQSDVMTHFKQKGELGKNIDQKLVYITKLYNEEMHLVVNSQINDIKDLAGKKVNFAEVNSGTQFSSRIIFQLLGIKVEEVNMGQNDALVKIKSGEIAGSVFIVGRPAAALAKLPKDPDMRLLPVPYSEVLEDNSYLPAVLTSQDYPALIPEGQQVETIAVGAVLAVFNWQANTDRHRRVSKFIAALFEKFDEFQKPARHQKWKEVNLAAALKGWNRYPPATQWLEHHASKTTTSSNIDPALARQQATRAAPGNPQEQDRLFRQFMEWSKSQARR